MPTVLQAFIECMLVRIAVGRPIEKTLVAPMVQTFGPMIMPVLPSRAPAASAGNVIGAVDPTIDVGQPTVSTVIACVGGSVIALMPMLGKGVGTASGGILQTFGGVLTTIAGIVVVTGMHMDRLASGNPADKCNVIGRTWEWRR